MGGGEGQQVDEETSGSGRERMSLQREEESRAEGFTQGLSFIPDTWMGATKAFGYNVN